MLSTKSPLLITLVLSSCTLYGVVDDCVQEELLKACQSDEVFARQTERDFDLKECLRSRERASIRLVCTKSMGNQ
jgi:hypothetical protein